MILKSKFSKFKIRFALLNSSQGLKFGTLNKKALSIWLSQQSPYLEVGECQQQLSRQLNGTRFSNVRQAPAQFFPQNVEKLKRFHPNKPGLVRSSLDLHPILRQNITSAVPVYHHYQAGRTCRQNLDRLSVGKHQSPRSH